MARASSALWKDKDASTWTRGAQVESSSDLDWDEEEKVTEHDLGRATVSARGTRAVAEGPGDAADAGQLLPPAPRASPSPPTGPIVSPPALPQLYMPGTPVLPPTSQLSLPASPYPAVPMPIRPTRVRRLPYYVAAVFFALLGGVGGFWLAPRAGVLQLAVKPPDAWVAVDGQAILGTPPFRIKKPAGVHRLAISRPGYDPFERDVQISARRKGHLDITLVPSVDTGFQLTGTPPNARVWLDGRPLVLDPHGEQALRATRIAAGPHVLEIKGDGRFQPWQGRFVQEPGRTVVVHANPTPILAAEASPGSAAGKGRKVLRRSPRQAEQSSISHDPFEKTARVRSRTRSQSLATEDIFESYGQRAAGASNCVATISSRPWAELLVDGKTTGKLTPLVDYSLPCGTHRLTFKNEDLMIERNERVTLAPGRPFKKIFQLVPDDL